MECRIFEESKFYLLTDNFIDVNPVNKYKISCDAKSISEALSKAYLCIICYDKNEKEITKADITVVDNIPACLVTGVSQDRKTLTI